MSNLRLTILTAIIATFMAGSFAMAQSADPMINFTGKVTEKDGSEILDGNYDFVFRLYNEKSGGVALWSESLNAGSRFSATIDAVNPLVDGIEYEFGADSASSTLRLGQYLSNATASGSVLITDFDLSAGTVTVASGSPAWNVGDAINNRPYVEGGIIDENLGSVNPLTGVDFSDQLYLEIIFNGETMQPRKTLTSVSHAFNATKLGGKSEADFASLDEDQIISGRWTFNNIVDIATSSANTALTITQDGNGNILEVKQGTTTSFAVLADGSVQIGEYNFPISDGAPGYVLKTDGFGSLSWQTDYAGSGGGSGLWATSSNDQFIFQSDTGHIVVLGNNSTSSLTGFHLQVTGDSLFDGISLRNQNEIRLYDSGTSNYLGIRASSSMATNLVLTLPGDSGVDGSALITDGNGNLRWDSPTSFVYVNPGTAGQIPYYASDGSALSATSSIFINPEGDFSVGNFFNVNQDGEVTLGSWQGDIIDTAFGGVGTSTFEAGSVLYAPSDDTVGEILAGGDGMVLKMIGGLPTWGQDLTVGGEISLWASSTNNLAIMPSDITDVVLIGKMATSAADSIMEVQGNAYFSNNISAQSMSLANALAVAYGGTGSSTPSGILLGDGAGNIVSLHNNSAVWNSTASTVAASSAGWDAASAGYAADGADWNTAFGWGNHAEQGYFSTTTDQILDVAYGGTGTSTWQINSLVFANANNSLSEILAGPNGYALVMQGGMPVWASTSPGTSHDLLSNLHSDTDPGIVERGDLIVGSSTPGVKWARMALGPDGYILRSDGADMYWATTTGITELGTIKVGKWEGDVVEVAFGGTGRSLWTAGSLVYASGTNEIGELLIGNNGYILQSVNGDPQWVSTTSLNIDASGIGGTMGPAQGGTGQDSSAWNGMVQVIGGVWSEVNGGAGQVAYWSDANTIAGENYLSLTRGGTGGDFSAQNGFLYFDGGTAVASNTIAISRTNLIDDGSGVVLSGNVLSLDSSGNWSGTFDGEEGSYYLDAVNLNNFIIPFSGALAATTTDALAEGGSNLYWSNARFDGRFDSRLSATSSLPNITELSSLNSVGIITSGTWNADVLAVEYGGTGTSTFEANSVLYASADDTVGEILAGTDGYVLKMLGGTPTWAVDLTVGGEVQLWATSSNDLLIYPTDITKVVLVGAMSTSSEGYIMEVTNGDALFTGNIDAQSLSLINALAVSEGGTGSTTPSGILVGDGAGNIVSLQNNSIAWNSTASTVSANSGGWDAASAGYAADGADWNTAYSWGNHATRGYFSTTTDQVLNIAYGGTGTTTWQANSLVYADAQNSLSEILAGVNGQVLLMQDGVPTWSDSAPSAAHPLLGVQHSDTANEIVQRGDLVIGSSTPGIEWARLALGPEGYILKSDGVDTIWATTTDISALGTILVGRWEADVIDIAYGGTGATTATGARENLGLSDVYKFGINATGTDGYVWKSDGDGRGEWVSTSSLNIAGGSNDSKLIGTTSVEFDGHFATTTPEGSFEGYMAGNILCDYEFSGSHFCRTYDILVTAEQDDISAWSGKVWVAEGPPGFTSNSNDCQGWTSNSDTHLGAWWDLNSNGGKGWLVSCDYTRPLACCRR